MLIGAPVLCVWMLYDYLHWKRWRGWIILYILTISVMGIANLAIDYSYALDKGLEFRVIRLGFPEMAYYLLCGESFHSLFVFISHIDAYYFVPIFLFCCAFAFVGGVTVVAAGAGIHCGY